MFISPPLKKQICLCRMSSFSHRISESVGMPALSIVFEESSVSADEETFCLSKSEKMLGGELMREIKGFRNNKMPKRSIDPIDGSKPSCGHSLQVVSTGRLEAPWE